MARPKLMAIFALAIIKHEHERAEAYKRELIEAKKEISRLKRMK